MNPQRYILLYVVVLAMALKPSVVSARELSLDERVEAQRAIEQVYWSHRLWPEENPRPKPPLSEVLGDDAIRARVEDYLAKSNALETIWQRPVTSIELQTELDRMAKRSRDPQVLTELFAALGNDPFVIAETLARGLLVDRLIRSRYSGEERPALGHADASGPWTLPAIVSTDCIIDSWMPTADDTGSRARHSVVWTGAEMIVWGGSPYLDESFPGHASNTGGRYNPATDTWTPTSTDGAVPSERFAHTAVWTGTEMIVWGGRSASTGMGGYLTNTGGRYNPATDTWAPTSVGANVPFDRYYHSAVWTGTQMIVWGGLSYGLRESSGGRYDPASDSWTPTEMTSAPIGRNGHSAVWTGSEMIVWGGLDDVTNRLNSGGCYNPSTNSWTATSTGASVPTGRWEHTSVWTGSKMIVWGGQTGQTASSGTNTGGRYDPATDSWTATSPGAGVPSARYLHTSVWTESEMIVWGGSNGAGAFDTGGRYDPAADLWISTPIGANVPDPRASHSAVWTGSEMIVWGGGTSTGGRYCVRPLDSDDDGIPDSSDACPLDPANDVDGDGICADADPCPFYGPNDSDHDGVCGNVDNCEVVFNGEQQDSDTDGRGDLCDNCPTFPNASQADADADGAGDACDCQPLDPGGARPAAVAGVSVAKIGTSAQLSWTPILGADAYAVTRGNLASRAPSQYGSCLEEGVSGTTYADATIPAPGEGFFYLVQAQNLDCGLGSLGTDSNEQQRINANPSACAPVTDTYFSSHSVVFGTVSGTGNTLTSNDAYLTLREVLSTDNPPTSRYSHLEGRLTFNVPAATIREFHVEAFRTNSTDGDSFEFAYSTDGGASFTPLGMIVPLIDNGTAQVATLPPGTSGAVIIRVVDTDRTPGHQSLDIIAIDQMWVRNVP